MHRVVVVGGGLAGMAAAARLAKLGHAVVLCEAGDRLGGAWSVRRADGHLLDPAPTILPFPAPWRDLFRKTGRPLEAELQRGGHALVPAPPPVYQMADGMTLTLPTDRAEQYATLSEAYGAATADRWRDLLDSYDSVWQALRPLGLEAELDRRRVRASNRTLQPRRSVADVAAAAPHPHLRAIIRSVAYRLGSTPERTPGWCAVDLVVARTFGRWMIEDGRTSVLLDALTTRLVLRKVVIRLNTQVVRIDLTDGAVSGVTTSDGESLPARAVVCTADPWQLVDVLLPRGAARDLRRSVRRLRPARAPQLSSVADPAAVVGETVRLDVGGVPVVRYARPGCVTVHDFTHAPPDPSWGPQWRRASDWTRRPAIRSEVPGLFLAGASSPAGGTPSAVVLSAALASDACHDYAQMSVFPLKEHTS
jgi:phytoene dehydrogenase-like protein